MIATVSQVIDRVAFETGLPRTVLTGDSRARAHVRVRYAVYWLGRHALGRSLAVVGQAIGDRDHKTIHTGLSAAEKLRDRDPAFRMLTDRLFREFTS